MNFADHVTRPVHMTKRLLSAVFMTSALWLAGPALAELPATQHYGSVEYLTGGFGLEESTAIKNAMPDYPLAFTFAARNGSRSAYVANVQVVIRDQYDATVLNVESQGPFLLARLSPGNYQAHVTYQNETQSRSITVTDTKSTRVVFEWVRDDASMTDQSTEPASDAQAESATDSTPGFKPGSIPGLD